MIADGGPLLSAAAAVLLVFLLALVTRYVLLLWLGYLHLLESRHAVDPQTTPLPRVTVVVPVHNEQAGIEAALRSLLRLDYDGFDVVVVDDGSTDRTAELARRFEGQWGGTTVRVLSKRNGGKASALNVGIGVAKTPLILCMDGDSRLEPATLRYAAAHFADPRVGAVAGNVKVVNRNAVWTRLQALEYIQGLNLARRAQGFLRVVNIIPGPIGMFRRAALVEVGGYDTDTFAEDADLTLKLLVAGWHVAYEDRAIAWTEAPESLLDLISQRYRWTRGILQSLGKRKARLVAPEVGFVVWLSLVAMVFEALVWPVANVLGNLVFALVALGLGAAPAVIAWWVLITMLDVAAAVYAVAIEEEDLRLVPYAIVYRLLFITLIDVAKLFATVEQAARVRMTWGELARAGRI